ncbi:MAG: copper resistance protein CopC/CopD [Actinobacteria bacterium]|nr:copper resistance protein CopC/CopD [Actinomycetota bacterium]
MLETVRRGVRVRTVFAALLAAAWLLAVDISPAWGHAALVSSEPEAGTQLATAPGIVTVRFSEPLILDLSSLRVTDPDGQVWERTSAGERTMAASLDTTAQGVYLVEWKTVSPLDGHTLRGSFRFGVGVTPTETAPATTVEPGTADVVLAVGRAVEYAALLTAVGMLLLSRLGRRDPPLSWVRVRLAWTLGVALAAGAAVVVGEALLAAPTLSPASVGRYLTAEPGVPRLVRLAAEGVAVLAAAGGLGWAAAVGAVAAVGALAASGHAAAAQPTWWAVTVDAAHLVSAGLWAGGILALAMLRPPGGWQAGDARELLRRFSPVAIPAFIATVASGSLRGTQELLAVRDLWTTSYGQVLALKLTAVALMVPLSWRAWQRRVARPRREAVLSVIVVAAAALLAAYPVPPRRAAEDAAQAHGTASPAYPREDDLTLAATTGDVVVGLTLRPGRPGRNDVLVHLLPGGGPENAEGRRAMLTVAGKQHTLESCGLACRETALVLDGGETIEVTMDGVNGSPARFPLPPLPAPDGTDLLERMARVMGDLRSLRYEEVFGPTDPPIRSSAAMVAPDRLRFEVHTYDRVTIRVGDVIWRRKEDQPWMVSRGPSLRVPSYIWDYEDKRGVHVVDAEDIDGTGTQILSFFVLVGDQSPIWYRLWIDDGGLVRRAEMRAQGHFMDHTYFGFDAPITIGPPDDAPPPPQEDDT